MGRPQSRCLPDLEALVRAAAEDLIECVDRAIGATGSCRIAMAGGSTPRPVYRFLAQPEVSSLLAWDKVHVFWGDERCVPPTDSASNYRMVCQALLDRVQVPEGQVHRIRGELPPGEAAREYEEELGDEPLGLVLLGMGTDGHTASLFPGSQGVDQIRERVIATVAPVEPVHRVSLTLRAINEASAIRFWVSGSNKADRLAEVFRQFESGEPRLPAARVRPRSRDLCWILDEAAAERL